MFCEHCGNKIQIGHKFCTKCGESVVFESQQQNEQAHALDEKWWYRLLKVAYIALYIPLPFVLVIVWSINSSSDYNNSGNYFWYSLLTLTIYLIVARMIKLAILYVAMGSRPKWEKEFRRIF